LDALRGIVFYSLTLRRPKHSYKRTLCLRALVAKKTIATKTQRHEEENFSVLVYQVRTSNDGIF